MSLADDWQVSPSAAAASPLLVESPSILDGDEEGGRDRERGCGLGAGAEGRAKRLRTLPTTPDFSTVLQRNHMHDFRSAPGPDPDLGTAAAAAAAKSRLVLTRHDGAAENADDDDDDGSGGSDTEHDAESDHKGRSPPSPSTHQSEHFSLPRLERVAVTAARLLAQNHHSLHIHPHPHPHPHQHPGPPSLPHHGESTTKHHDRADHRLSTDQPCVEPHPAASHSLSTNDTETQPIAPLGPPRACMAAMAVDTALLHIDQTACLHTDFRPTLAAVGNTAAGLTVAIASATTVHLWAQRGSAWSLLCAVALAREDTDESLAGCDLGWQGLAVCGTLSSSSASLVLLSGGVQPLSLSAHSVGDSVQHILVLDRTYLVTTRFSIDSARLDLIKWSVADDWSAVISRTSLYCLDTTRPLLGLKCVDGSSLLVGLTQHRILVWDHVVPMLVCCIPFASGPILHCPMAVKLNGDVFLNVFSTDTMEIKLRTVQIHNIDDTERATHCLIEASAKTPVSAAAVAAGPFVVVPLDKTVALLSLPDLAMCGSLLFERACRGVAGSDRHLVVLNDGGAQLFSLRLASRSPP